MTTFCIVFHESFFLLSAAMGISIRHFKRCHAVHRSDLNLYLMACFISVWLLVHVQLLSFIGNIIGKWAVQLLSTMIIHETTSRNVYNIKMVKIMRDVMLIKILPWAADIHNCIIIYTLLNTVHVCILFGCSSVFFYNTKFWPIPKE